MVRGFFTIVRVATWVVRSSGGRIFGAFFGCEDKLFGRRIDTEISEVRCTGGTHLKIETVFGMTSRRWLSDTDGASGTQEMWAIRALESPECVQGPAKRRAERENSVL